jgi:hypothetical protein
MVGITGWNSLYFAMVDGFIDIVHWLIAQGNVLAAMKSNIACIPIHRAMDSKQTAIHQQALNAATNSTTTALINVEDFSMKPIVLSSSLYSRKP